MGASRKRASRATLANAEQADTRLTIAIAELCVAMKRYRKPLLAAKFDAEQVGETTRRMRAFVERLQTEPDVFAAVELAVWLLDRGCLEALRRELRALVEMTCAELREQEAP